MSSHLIVHQYDPAELIAAGAHGVIRDMIRFAPADASLRIIGVDAGGRRRLGVWHEEDVGGRRVAFLPVARFSAASRRQFLPHTARLAAGIARRARRAADASFVHVHRVELGALLGAVWRDSRLVQFVHTDSREAARFRTETFWRFMPALESSLERRAVRTAYRAFVFSAAAAARLGDVPSARRACNWYDDDVFRPAGAASGDLRIAWVGRFEPSKDPLSAIAALGELRRAGHPFTAWFAGGGSLESEMRVMIEREQLGDRVELAGTLSAQALASRLRTSRCLLVTSLWEGQPRAVLEALGSGIGVVSPGVGDVPLLVDHGRTGFVSEGRTPAELASFLARTDELVPPQEIASSVAGHRARHVVPLLYAGLECAS